MRGAKPVAYVGLRFGQSKPDRFTVANLRFEREGLLREKGRASKERPKQNDEARSRLHSIE